MSKVAEAGYNLENDLSIATGQWVRARVAELEEKGFSTDQSSSNYLIELGIYSRIASFAWEDYPNYTCPWHLFKWPHMRWEMVQSVVDIIEMLKQPTGSNVGGPMNLEPFQIMILLAFLGPYDPETDLRLLREGLLTIGRKNAKTTLVAAMNTAIMSLHPDTGGLLGQEIQVAASDRDQAGITYDMCDRFTNMDQSLGLSSKFNGVPSKKLLTHNTTLTKLRCLSSDAYRSHGANPAIVMFDEIGNVKHDAALEFYTILTSGFGAQDEPLTLLLSTQAASDQHFFSQQVDRAKRINEGLKEEKEFAGFVFELPEQDLDDKDLDPYDERLWHLANPGIDTIMRRQDMRNYAKKARELPALENSFRNLRHNQRVSPASALFSRTVWNRNAGHKPALEELEDRPCYIGFDLAETTDLCSMVVVFNPDPDFNDRKIVMPFFWIPGEGIRARSNQDKVPYDVWSKHGVIDATSSQVVDFAKVAQKFIWCLEKFDVQAVGFDRWRFKNLKLEIERAGFTPYDEKEFYLPFGQGFKDQHEAVELVEKDCLNGVLCHPNHPVLTWCATNAVIIRDPSGSKKIDKPSSYGRVDGIVALSLALQAMAQDELEGEPDSIYNDSSRKVFM